jgi:hypothetical protein
MLSDRFAVSTAKVIDHVAAQIAKAIGRPNSVTAIAPRRSRTTRQAVGAARRAVGRPKRR